MNKKNSMALKFSSYWKLWYSPAINIVSGVKIIRPFVESKYKFIGNDGTEDEFIVPQQCFVDASLCAQIIYSAHEPDENGKQTTVKINNIYNVQNSIN
jgi:hypothetical protein